MSDDRTELERFGLGADGALIHYEHAHRYLLAAQLARGLRVLDLASGSGYGTRVLRKAGLDVTALDLDLGCARDARPAVCARGESLPFADASFECVVCFEAIEHINDPELIVAEIARVLQPAGIALLSTPNRPLYSERSGRINPYHLRELDREELGSMLGRHFRHSTVFAQSVWAGSWIAPEHPTSAQSATLKTLDLPEELVPRTSPTAPWAPPPGQLADCATPQPAPLYFFVLCGHTRKRLAKLEKAADAAHLLHDSGQRLIGEMLDAQRVATDRSAEVESQVRHSRQLELDVASAHSRIARLEENERNISADLARERREHGSLRTHVENLEELIESERARAADVGDHAANLERRAGEHAGRLRELEAHIRGLESDRDERAARIVELETHSANLNTIHDADLTRIRELEAHATNLEMTRSAEITRIRELEVHATNLEMTRSAELTRIRELEAHAKNLERVLNERDEHITGLDAHTANLARVLQERDEQAAGREAHTSNLESALSDASARAGELESALTQGEQTSRVLEGERDRLREHLTLLRSTLGFRLLRRLGLLRDPAESAERKEGRERSGHGC